MLVLTISSTLAVAGAVVRPAAAQDSNAPKYTMPEYNAYNAAAAEKDAKQKVKLLDEFVAKYPNSTLLSYVYQAYWDAYLALRNFFNVTETTEKYLAMGEANPVPNRLTAAYQHSVGCEQGYNAKDTGAKEYLNKCRDVAQQGLSC